jgi:uroporphyrin-III C-methyltransferase
VVPGVTAASAAAAQFAFPLTHRGEARQLVLATGRLQDGEGRGDWAALTRADTTLALYMARDGVAGIASQLIAAGRSSSTPAAAVENAGAPQARLISSTLAGIGGAVADAGCGGPVIIVVGDVAARASAASASPAVQPDLRARRLP